MAFASKEDKDIGQWISYENFLSPGENCYTWWRFHFSSEKRVKHPQVTEPDLVHVWQKFFKACGKLMIVNNDHTAHLNISHYQFITNLKLKT